MSKCVKVRRDYEKIWQLNKRVIYLFWSSAETKFVSETISLEKKKKEITSGPCLITKMLSHCSWKNYCSSMRYLTNV
jgi:hypothetical protein